MKVDSSWTPYEVKYKEKEARDYENKKNVGNSIVMISSGFLMQILKANIQRLTCLNLVNPRSFSFREGKIDIKRIRSSIYLQNKVSVKES